MGHKRKTLFVLAIFSTLMVDCLGSSIDASFQTELLERINLLEKQGQKQAKKMQAMESRLEEQERTISDYKQGVVDLEQTVIELKVKQNPTVGVDQEESNSENNVTRVITRQERSKQAEPRQEVMRTRRALLGAEGPVAFHSVIKTSHVDNIGVNQNIIFPDVMLNLGGGYHNQQGVFLAQQPGIYIFSTSIMARDSGTHFEIDVHLMKNGQILANAAAHASTGRWDQGSVTVVTQLATGDEVWVSHYAPADTSLYGDYYDSFMGCLVMPL